MTTGSGFKEEFMCVLGLPVMTKKSFVRTEHMMYSALCIVLKGSGATWW